MNQPEHQRQLRKEIERLKSASMPGAQSQGEPLILTMTLRVNAQGTLVYASSALCDYLQSKREVLLGSLISEYFDEPLSQLFLDENPSRRTQVLFDSRRERWLEIKISVRQGVRDVSLADVTSLAEKIKSTQVLAPSASTPKRMGWVFHVEAPALSQASGDARSQQFYHQFLDQVVTRLEDGGGMVIHLNGNRLSGWFEDVDTDVSTLVQTLQQVRTLLQEKQRSVATLRHAHFAIAVTQVESSPEELRETPNHKELYLTSQLATKADCGEVAFTERAFAQLLQNMGESTQVRSWKLNDAQSQEGLQMPCRPGFWYRFEGLDGSSYDFQCRGPLQLAEQRKSVRYLALAPANDSPVKEVSLSTPRMANRQEFAHFQLIEKLATRPWGEHWKARLASGQLVALHIYRSDLSSDQLRRLQKTVAVLRKENPQGVARILQSGEANESFYVACEWLEAVPLVDILRPASLDDSDLKKLIRSLIEERSWATRTELDPTRSNERQARVLPLHHSLSLMLSLCKAIQALHDLNLYHLNLNPSNIWVSGDGSVRLQEVGFWLFENGKPHGELDENIRCTLEFSAPEMINGVLDARSDVYSLGAVFYLMLSGWKHFVSTGDFHTDNTWLKDHRAEEIGKLNQQIDADLSFIVHRALHPQMTQRYPSAASVHEDIKCYLKGQPLAVVQLDSRQAVRTLWQKNRPLLLAMLGAVAILAGSIAFSHLELSRRLERTLQAQVQAQQQIDALLAQERARAEDFRRGGEALLLSAQDRFSRGDSDTALKDLKSALVLNEELIEAHLLRAQIFIVQQEWTAATEALQTYIQQPNARAEAKDLLLLAEDVRVTGIVPWGRWIQLFTKLGYESTLEAARSMQKSAMEQTIQALAQVAPNWKPDREGLAGWPESFRPVLKSQNVQSAFAMLDDGTLAVDLSGTRIQDLRGLAGLPISHLSLEATQVTDLFALQKMPLRYLNLSDTRVSSLEPLKGMPLQALLCNRVVSLRDVSPLAGMPLVFLDLEGTQVADISPLNGLPLKSLSLMTTPVSNLAPLQGMALDSLNIRLTSVEDLSPLRGMPLTRLALESEKISNLSPLEGMKLQVLYALRINTNDIGVLRGMPLEYLILSGTPVDQIEPLRGMPLQYLDLNNTKVSDLSPLRGAPLKSLYLSGTQVVDVSPLTGMPIEALDLSGSNVQDLWAIRGLPLRTLSIADTRVNNLIPLEGMNLQQLYLAPQNMAVGIQAVVGMKTLERMGVVMSRAEGVRTYQDFTRDEFLRRLQVGEFRQ